MSQEGRVPVRIHRPPIKVTPNMAKPSGLENLRFPVFWWNSVETAAAEPKPEYCDIEVAAKPPIDPFKRSPGATHVKITLSAPLHCPWSL